MHRTHIEIFLLFYLLCCDSSAFKSAGGMTIGIVPAADASEVSDAIDIPIITGLGGARDNINALSCSVLVAVGMGPGTCAEVALALKAGETPKA